MANKKEDKIEEIKTTNEMRKTEADLIWNEIKGIKINIYALDNQTVEDHVVRKNIPGSVVFLRPKSPAVISVLQDTIGDNFVVNIASGGFITIERNMPLPIDQEEEYIYFPRPNGKVDKILKKNLL